MKLMIKTALFAALVLGSASGVYAGEYTKGFVKKVVTKTGKVTIKHGELKNLEMPGMTMVFRVKDKAMLEKLKAGSNIEFIAERVKGKLTVVELK